MADEYFHFFQKSDVDDFVKAADKIVIEALADALEAAGIDVTDLRRKETTIFNSGIMIQKGDVSAQTLAVGSGAIAQTVPAEASPSGRS